MRCNQVSINIERFGKYVPESYPSDVQRIKVYCDDYKSIYIAFSKAYALAINELILMNFQIRIILKCMLHYLKFTFSRKISSVKN